MSLLEHEDHRAERRRHREEVEGHRLQGHEHRAEAGQERDERARDDQPHDGAGASGHRVLVVHVEPRQSAHPQARAGQTGEGARVGSAELAHQRGQLGWLHVLAGDQLDERGVTLAADEGVHDEGRQQAHVGEVVAALPGQRAKREHARHPGIRGQGDGEAIGGGPALVADGERVLRQLQDHAYPLGHAALAHRAQLPQCARGFHRRQPVAPRQLGSEAARLQREQDHGGAGDDEHRHRVSGHPRPPAVPPASPCRRARGEQTAGLDTVAQAGEQRRKQGGGEQDRSGHDEQAAGGDGSQLAQGHEEQPQEPERDRGPREKDRAPGVGGRVRRGLLGAAPLLPRFAEAAEREQRVVDPEPEAEHGDHALEADRERPHAGEEDGGAEREHDGEGAGGDGEQGGHCRPESDEEQEESQGQRAALPGSDLLRGRAPQVEVQGRLARPAQRGPREPAPQTLSDFLGGTAQPWHEVGPGVAHRVEADDDERAVRAAHGKEQLVVGIEVRQRPGDVRRAFEPGDDLLQGRAPLRRIRGRHLACHEQQAPREGRFEPRGQDLLDLRGGAARDARRDLQHLLGALRERHQRGPQRDPGRDDEAAPADDPSAESARGLHAAPPNAGRKLRPSGRPMRT